MTRQNKIIGLIVICFISITINFITPNIEYQNVESIKKDTVFITQKQIVVDTLVKYIDRIEFRTKIVHSKKLLIINDTLYQQTELDSLNDVIINSKDSVIFVLDSIIVIKDEIINFQDKEIDTLLINNNTLLINNNILITDNLIKDGEVKKYKKKIWRTRIIGTIVAWLSVLK